MNKVNWSVLPTIFKEKYELLTEPRHEIINLSLFKEMERMPIQIPENSTSSYSIFSTEYNAMLLTVHCVENLLMFEDIRHEKNGHAWFQIEIPLIYFRYPAFNNIRDEFAYREEMTDEELNALTNAIKSTKEKMHYGNDENIVKEHLHKLEFLSLFSYFEAYLRNILIKELGCSKTRADKVMKNSENNTFKDTLKHIIQNVNPEIEKLLISIKPKFFEFIDFCCLLRNLHTHQLGRANKDFMQKCTKQGLIEEQFGTTETDEKVSIGVRTNFGAPEKIIELDRYITLSGFSFYFRNYVREYVFIIESCILEKDNSRGSGLKI